MFVQNANQQKRNTKNATKIKNNASQATESAPSNASKDEEWIITPANSDDEWII